MDARIEKNFFYHSDSCIKILRVMASWEFFSEHFEDEFVDILVSVVKMEFVFFQMEIKSVFCQPAKEPMRVLAKAQQLSMSLSVSVYSQIYCCHVALWSASGTLKVSVKINCSMCLRIEK